LGFDRAGDRARLSDRFLAKTGSSPRRGTIVERYRGSYGLLEDGARAGESQRRAWNATAACLQLLADGSRDPFAEQVLALMRVAPKGCATAVDRLHDGGLRRSRTVKRAFYGKALRTKKCAFVSDCLAKKKTRKARFFFFA
jgi:hypothetical protein